MYSKDVIKKIVSECVIVVAVLITFIATMGYYRHMVSDLVGMVVVLLAVVVVCGRVSVLAGYLIYRRKKMEVAKYFLAITISLSIVYIINLHITYGVLSEEAMKYGVYYCLGLCTSDVALRICVEIKRMIIQRIKK